MGLQGVHELYGDLNGPPTFVALRRHHDQASGALRTLEGLLAARFTSAAVLVRLALDALDHSPRPGLEVEVHPAYAQGLALT